MVHNPDGQHHSPSFKSLTSQFTTTMITTCSPSINTAISDLVVAVARRGARLSRCCCRAALVTRSERMIGATGDSSLRCSCRSERSKLWTAWRGRCEPRPTRAGSDADPPEAKPLTMPFDGLRPKTCTSPSSSSAMSTKTTCRISKEELDEVAAPVGQPEPKSRCERMLSRRSYAPRVVDRIGRRPAAHGEPCIPTRRCDGEMRFP